MTELADLVHYIQINPNTDISVMAERDNNIFGIPRGS